MHPLQYLIAYGQAYRRTIWLAIACSALNKIFDLAPPALIGAAVDVVVQQQDSLLARLGIVPVEQQLIVLALLSVLVWALESAFEYAHARLWRELAQRIQHDMRLDTYQHLQQMEMAFFEERSTGGLMAVLNDDINQLERFLDVGANEILQVVTTVVIIGGTFFVIAPSVAWMAVLPMPFILWGAIQFQHRLAPRYRQVRDRVSLLNGRLSNNLSGMATIKSFTAETYEADRVRVDSEAYRASNRLAIALSAAFIPLIRIIILLGFIAVLVFGGLEATNGQLSAGTYSVMIFLTQRLLWPLTRLGEVLDQYQRAMASIYRVKTLLETPVAIRTGDVALPISRVRGDIAFEKVTFAYRDRAPIVENLTLRVPAGQTIAIVGPTGSGKSTLVKLLLRFYEVNSGRVTVDGIDVRNLRLRDLRQAIGVVSQDVFLFHGTVAENIAYGSFDATPEAIVNAAKTAEAHEFIQQLPQQYDTIVGERGQKLSGGQRQRLAIARAVLKDPPILILDEATSAVDNETEAAIQRSLDAIAQGRTILAIAHRLSTIRNADCIYVMERGRIVERGTHEELNQNHGLYAGLWNVQLGLSRA
ncbi:MAG: ABC transporter ATP-binding protein [Cyanobacteria bacterium P01_F01_bin.33]